MKRIKSLFLVLALFSLIAPILFVPENALAVNYNSYVDNHYQDMSAYGAYKEDNSWMVQVRFIAKVLNLSVNYDEKTEVVSLIQPARDGYDSIGVYFENNNRYMSVCQFSNIGTEETTIRMNSAATIRSDDRMYVDFKAVVEAFNGEYYVNTQSGEYPAGVYVYTAHHLLTGGAKQYVEAEKPVGEFHLQLDTHPFSPNGAIWISDRGRLVSTEHYDYLNSETYAQAVAFLNRKQLSFLIHEIFNNKKYGNDNSTDSIVSNGVQNISGEVVTGVLSYLAALGEVESGVAGVAIGTAISVISEDTEQSSYEIMADVLAQTTLNDDKGCAKLQFFKTTNYSISSAGVPMIYDTYSMKIDYYQSQQVFNCGYEQYYGHWVDFGSVNNFETGYSKWMINRASSEPQANTGTSNAVIIDIPPTPSSSTTPVNTLGVVKVLSPLNGEVLSNNVYLKWEKYLTGHAMLFSVLNLDTQEEQVFEYAPKTIKADVSLIPGRYKLVAKALLYGSLKAISDDIYFTVSSPPDTTNQTIDPESISNPAPIAPIEPTQGSSQAKLSVNETYPSNMQTNVYNNSYIRIEFDQKLVRGNNFDNIRLTDKNGQVINCIAEITPYKEEELCIYQDGGNFNCDDTITVVIPENAIISQNGNCANSEVKFSFYTESSAGFPRLSGYCVWDENTGTVDFSGVITWGPNSGEIYVIDENSNIIRVNTQINNDTVVFDISSLQKGKKYYYFIGVNALTAPNGATNSIPYRCEFLI